MQRTCTALAFVGSVVLAAPAAADPAAEIRGLYERLVTAQNARDIAAVRVLFLDSPKFLWISDGMAYWGRDAVTQRMALFQTADTWHVDPALDKSVAVEIGASTAFLHLPLVLTIGPKDKPERLGFLVDVLCADTAEGWRIAALFTTTDKSN
jgi:hypothetical protein